MKKLLILASMPFFFNFSYAQTNLFPPTGKVGIGTITPASQLDILTPAINGGESLMKFKVLDAANDYMEIMNATGLPTTFIPAIKGFVSSGNTAALYIVAETNTTNDTGINPIAVFDSRVNGAKAKYRPLFGWDSYGSRQMIMLANGNLGLGINNPTEKLSVNGKIRAKEVKVEAANWPDYVFTKEYQLPSLQEMEKHILERGHLLGIPSAEEVKNNGLELGEMNKRLLQKIEEITLHLIEKDKQLKIQQSNMKLQEHNLKLQDARISKLENLLKLTISK